VRSDAAAGGQDRKITRIHRFAGIKRMETMELTILMPCLNEIETVEICVQKAKRFLEDNGIEGEVLIADNGSSDGSQKAASAAGARVIVVDEPGYGSALGAGIEAAHGQYVIMGDADDSYDFSSLESFVTQLREGADLVMGDRFAGGIAPGAMPALHRYLGNPLLSWLGRLFFGSKVHDFHCGLRGFRRDRIVSLNLLSSGMEFASEMIVKATLANLVIVEVATTLSPDGRTRPPHLRTWRDGWRHLRFLLLYSPRWLFLYPGGIVVALSVVVMLAVEISVVHIGAATFGVDTLVAASALLLIGLQSIFFAIFTKVYGINEGFLPADARIDRFKNFFSMEVGVGVGVTLVLGGFVGVIIALVKWQNAKFGILDATNEIRVVTPSVTALAAGCQIALSSVFLSILEIRRQVAVVIEPAVAQPMLPG
jgi:glycosyltransferase involved in cell wall biosynthesis